MLKEIYNPLKTANDTYCNSSHSPWQPQSYIHFLKKYSIFKDPFPLNCHGQYFPLTNLKTVLRLAQLDNAANHHLGTSSYFAWPRIFCPIEMLNFVCWSPNLSSFPWLLRRPLCTPLSLFGCLSGYLTTMSGSGSHGLQKALCVINRWWIPVKPEAKSQGTFLKVSMVRAWCSSVNPG